MVPRAALSLSPAGSDERYPCPDGTELETAPYTVEAAPPRLDIPSTTPLLDGM